MYERNIINREDELNSLINIIEERKDYRENSSNGLSILLNGSWGSGKTTFVDNFKENEELKEKYEILKYNANEFDFYENPYIPFFSFIQKYLKVELEVNKLARITSKHAIKTVLNTSYMVLNTLFNIKTGKTLDEVKKTFDNIKDDLDKEDDCFKEFENFIKIKEKIQDKLKRKIKTIKKPIIIIIDELDRCNPRFAIDTLEIIKYFMDIDDLIIVLALDEGQLQESVKTIYGQNMNVDIYFSKFFDYKMNLKSLRFSQLVDVESIEPEDNPNIMNSIDHMYQELNITPREGHKIYIELLKKFKKFKHNGHKMTADQVVFIFLLLIMKQINNSFYSSIIEGDYDYYIKYIEDKTDIAHIKLKRILRFKVNNGNEVSAILRTYNDCKNDIYISLDNLYRVRNDDIPNFVTARNNLASLSRYIPQISEGASYSENLNAILNS